jgi:spore germination protein GerM
MKISHHPILTKPWYRALILLLISTTGGVSWWIWQANLHTNLRESTTVETPVKGSLNPSETLPPQVSRPQIYQLRALNNQVQLIPVAINSQQKQPEALLKEIFNHLFNDPRDQTLSTAIPVGTHLNNLRVEKGAIYVDLSNEFKQGGGSASMIYRVAQVLYTATSIDPNSQVYLSIEGQPIDAAHPLGGEGVVLDQPLSRKQMAKDFPWVVK